MAQDWKNRIVGSGNIDPHALMAHPQNYRRHSESQQGAMEAVFDDLGWLQNIVVSKRTMTILDGHMRVELAQRRGVPTVPVVYVDLDESEERKALATIDPLGALASVDTSVHEELMGDLGMTDERLDVLFAGLSELWDESHIDHDSDSESEQWENPYTKKTPSPIYEPTGIQPEVQMLCNSTRTNELISEIERSDIPDDVREFLIKAAYRHTVFDYGDIAEYYAHASQEVQNLMERSALVIIDFDQAIELGYVKIRSVMDSVVATRAIDSSVKSDEGDEQVQSNV